MLADHYIAGGSALYPGIALIISGDASSSERFALVRFFTGVPGADRTASCLHLPHFQILDHDNAAVLDGRRDRLAQGVLAAPCELRLQIAEVDADLTAMI
jgi:hypothetical protein